MRKHKTDRRRRNWTEEENAFLRANYGKLSRAEIARKLGRNPRVVAEQEVALGLRDRRKPPAHRWGVEEITYLQRHYGRMPVAEIAQHLGRAEGAVKHKASELGVTRPCAQRPKVVQVLEAVGVQPGDEVLVTVRNGNGLPITRQAIVKSIYLNQGHIDVEWVGAGWRESFLLADLVTGELQIKVLGRRSA